MFLHKFIKQTLNFYTFYLFDSSLARSVVHDVKGIVDLIKCIVELLLWDDQRRSNVKYRWPNPLEDSVIKEFLFELLDNFWDGILELLLDQLSIFSDDIESCK